MLGMNVGNVRNECYEMLGMQGSFDRCNLMLRMNMGNVRNQCGKC